MLQLYILLEATLVLQIVGVAFPLQVAMMSNGHLHFKTLPARQVLLTCWAQFAAFSALLYG